jgi:hypothetical protein
MFNFFRNIGKVNKVWGLLNEKYFMQLNGKIGGTVIKIEEDRVAGNQLLVQTDNENVRSILQKNESQIINDINIKLGINLIRINVI